MRVAQPICLRKWRRQTRSARPSTLVLTEERERRRHHHPFSSADTKGAVVTVADMSTLEVEADVSESNLAALKVERCARSNWTRCPKRERCTSAARDCGSAKATVTAKIRFHVRTRDPARHEPRWRSSPNIPEAQRAARPAVSAQALKRNGAQVVYMIRDGKAVAYVGGVDRSHRRRRTVDGLPGAPRSCSRRRAHRRRVNVKPARAGARSRRTAAGLMLRENADMTK